VQRQEIVDEGKVRKRSKHDCASSQQLSLIAQRAAQSCDWAKPSARGDRRCGFCEFVETHICANTYALLNLPSGLRVIAALSLLSPVSTDNGKDSGIDAVGKGGRDKGIDRNKLIWRSMRNSLCRASYRCNIKYYTHQKPPNLILLGWFSLATLIVLMENAFATVRAISLPLLHLHLLPFFWWLYVCDSMSKCKSHIIDFKINLTHSLTKKGLQGFGFGLVWKPYNHQAHEKR